MLRARQFCALGKTGLPVLIASEQVATLVVDLPAGPARQRAALLTYAVEDRIAQPIETVLVAPLRLQGAVPGRVLACVVARQVLDDLVTLPGMPMPDMLLIRRPDAPASGLAWAVWRDGARAIVRVSDGTGFAVSVDMLPMLWARAGKPVLTSLGAALPSGLPFADLSAAPPDPDPAEVTFRFPVVGSGTDRSASLRPFVRAAQIMLAGCVVLLGLAIAENLALGRIAAAQQATAQVALSAVLPGVTVTPDVTPILTRLAPVVTQPDQGRFLPQLAAMSAVLAGAGPAVTLRRLGWADTDDQLTMTLQAAGLDDLQTVEQKLTDAGFTVTSGAATAGDGGADVDMTIAGPNP